LRTSSGLIGKPLLAPLLPHGYSSIQGRLFHRIPCYPAKQKTVHQETIRRGVGPSANRPLDYVAISYERNQKADKLKC
jgi:hypothetical protein